MQEQDPQAPVPRRQTINDRDAALEQTYRYPDRRPGLSTLGFVSRLRDDLFAEFEAWRAMNTLTPSNVGDALEAWETYRFGRRLEPAAHGILMARLTGKEKVDDSPRFRRALAYVQRNPRTKDEKDSEYMARIILGAGLMGSVPDSPVRGFPELSEDERARVEDARNEPREPGADDE